MRIPYLRLIIIVSHLEIQELRPTAGHVGFVVDEVALKQVSLRTFRSILASIILFILHIQPYFVL